MKKIIDWVAIIISVLLFVGAMLIVFSLVMTDSFGSLLDILTFGIIFIIVSTVLDRGTKAAKEKGWIK